MKVLWKLALVVGIASCYVNSKIKVLKGGDPGLCSKKNNGETLLVRDRQDRNKLLICAADNGVYAWRTLDGTSPPGEFFNPAYDCTSILNKDPKAKDGNYWINLGNKSSPKKVWCDMVTDGGGFMLIGRKNTSETWSVPSNSKPVTPFGEPHWSSDLGNTPIVDFRVQVATREDFKSTKSHWYYRLRTPRKLKNLMIINKGGCDKHSPGIGDIAYVKDLMADTIVTRNFRCSRFGLAHHARTKFGWYMMNSCLEKPCQYGFAYHPLIKYQTDYSGAFSYSASSSVSGISHGATAFVGCDNGKCCSCYGPKAGTNNYCSKECKSQKNGTVHKNNVFTWFWVRASLPKRPWSKCMDYKVKENGKVVWYKFVGGSEVPVMGRCEKEKVRFYEGMLVVPNNKTAAKVPSVTGMMVYRTDNQKLYVQGDKKLKLIAEEKLITDVLNKDIAEVRKQVKSINQSITNRLRLIQYDFPSNILIGMPSFVDQLKQWLPSHNSLVLCYRASEDSWASQRFHAACDGKGATVTIIRVKSYILGGYTDISWGGSSSGAYRSSSKSFIFSLRNRYNVKPFKADVYRNSGKAIFTYPGCGPTFGGGHDMNIVNNAGKSTSSYSNFGYTYRPPSGYSYGASNTRALLAGGYNFTPSEVEVFYFI